MDALFLDAPKTNRSCGSVIDLQAELRYLLAAKATPTKAEHISVTLELRPTAVLVVPSADAENSNAAGAGPGSGATTAVAAAEPAHQVNVLDTLLDQPQDDPVLQRAVAKHLITAIGEVDGSGWTVRQVSRVAHGWTFTYACKDSLQAWNRQAAKKPAKLAIGEWSNKDGQDPVTMSRPAFDCRGFVEIEFAKTNRCISIKYEHTLIHKTVAELSEIMAPPPPPAQAKTQAKAQVKAQAKAPKTPKSNGKKRQADEELPEGASARPARQRKKKDSTGPAAPVANILPEVPGAVPVGGSAQRPLYNPQNGTGQDGEGRAEYGNNYPEALVGDSSAATTNGRSVQEIAAAASAAVPTDSTFLNLPPGEAERRRDVAIKLLTEVKIDPKSLSTEQFEIFANQAPELQTDSLAMLVKYGAERLCIIHPPNKDDSAPTPDSTSSTPSQRPGNNAAAQQAVGAGESAPPTPSKTPKSRSRKPRKKASNAHEGQGPQDSQDVPNAQSIDNPQTIQNAQAAQAVYEAPAPASAAGPSVTAFASAPASALASASATAPASAPGSARRPRETRRACDTCKGEKEKCDKAKPSCSRCVSIGATCYYAPAKPRKPRASKVDQSAAEPTPEPAAEPTPEPAIDPAIDPAVDPAIDPAIEPAVEPAVEPTVEHAVQSTVEVQGMDDDDEAEEEGEQNDMAASTIYQHSSGLTFPRAETPRNSLPAAPADTFAQASNVGTSSSNYSYPPPVAESYPAPVAESYPAPVADSYPAPVADSYPAPVADSYPAAITESYPAAVSETSMATYSQQPAAAQEVQHNQQPSKQGSPSRPRTQLRHTLPVEQPLHIDTREKSVNNVTNSQASTWQSMSNSPATSTASPNLASVRQPRQQKPSPLQAPARISTPTAPAAAVASAPIAASTYNNNQLYDGMQQSMAQSQSSVHRRQNSQSSPTIQNALYQAAAQTGRTKSRQSNSRNQSSTPVQNTPIVQQSQPVVTQATSNANIAAAYSNSTATDSGSLPGYDLFTQYSTTRTDQPSSRVTHESSSNRIAYEPYTSHTASVDSNRYSTYSDYSTRASNTASPSLHPDSTSQTVSSSYTANTTPTAAQWGSTSSSSQSQAHTYDTSRSGISSTSSYNMPTVSAQHSQSLQGFNVRPQPPTQARSSTSMAYGQQSQQSQQAQQSQQMRQSQSRQHSRQSQPVQQSQQQQQQQQQQQSTGYGGTYSSQVHGSSSSQNWYGLNPGSNSSSSGYSSRDSGTAAGYSSAGSHTAHSGNTSYGQHQHSHQHQHQNQHHQSYSSMDSDAALLENLLRHNSGV